MDKTGMVSLIESAMFRPELTSIVSGEVGILANVSVEASRIFIQYPPVCQGPHHCVSTYLVMAGGGSRRREQPMMEYFR